MLNAGQKYCVVCGAEVQSAALQRFWVWARPQSWFIITMFVLFFPVGLYLMWRYGAWKFKPKILVTAAVLGFVGIAQVVPVNDSAPGVQADVLPSVSSPKPKDVATSFEPSPSASPSALPSPSIAPSTSPTPSIQRSALSKPKPKPKPKPTGVFGNPWGYNFSCCKLIYDPPSSFCSYFDCIDNFWNGIGYVVQCEDGMFSKSGGRNGVCSHHDGFGRNLYAR